MSELYQWTFTRDVVHVVIEKDEPPSRWALTACGITLDNRDVDKTKAMATCLECLSEYKGLTGEK